MTCTGLHGIIPDRRRQALPPECVWNVGKAGARSLGLSSSMAPHLGGRRQERGRGSGSGSLETNGKWTRGGSMGGPGGWLFCQQWAGPSTALCARLVGDF